MSGIDSVTLTGVCLWAFGHEARWRWAQVAGLVVMVLGSTIDTLEILLRLAS